MKDALLSALFASATTVGIDLPPLGEKLTIAGAFAVLLWWVLGRQTRQLDRQNEILAKQTEILAELAHEIKGLSNRTTPSASTSNPQ